MMEDRIKALESCMEELNQEVNLLKDIHAIRRLQHAYGYYIDKCLYDETVDLFSEKGEVHFLGGIFKGRAGVHRLYCGRFRENFTSGVNGPQWGFLLDHPQLQDVIDVSPDRKTALGRFRSMMQAGRNEDCEEETRQWWEGGIYENTYVREDGVWKMGILNYRPVWHATFEDGWAKTPPKFVPLYAKTFPDDPLGPDELKKPAPELWPETDIVPFHYPHPVTGKMLAT